MPPTQILIAEDHALLADALQMLLNAQTDMCCIGVAKDGEQALQRTLATVPDVLLLDLGLPKLDGLGVMDALNRAQVSTRVLVVTARQDEASIRAALSLGAAGYLPKNQNSDELLLAIRRISQGQRYISADIALLFMPDTRSISTSKLTPSESTTSAKPPRASTAKTSGASWAFATVPKWQPTPFDCKALTGHRPRFRCTDIRSWAYGNDGFYAFERIAQGLPAPENFSCSSVVHLFQSTHCG